jgi:hypothetical protein
MKISGDKLTISGGDLEKPVTLRRVWTGAGSRCGSSGRTSAGD